MKEFKKNPHNAKNFNTFVTLEAFRVINNFNLAACQANLVELVEYVLDTEETLRNAPLISHKATVDMCDDAGLGKNQHHQNETIKRYGGLTELFQHIQPSSRSDKSPPQGSSGQSSST